MLKDGFLRFCDDPEIACCKAEKELEQLRAELTELKALAQAKADGWLAILPCKVGDTVYAIKGGKILKQLVWCVRYSESNTIGFDDKVVKTGSTEQCKYVGGFDFRFSDFGKTVFLTKEAAEKALGGGKDV